MDAKILNNYASMVERICAFLEEKQITRQDFADTVGIDLKTVYNYLSKKTIMQATAMIAIARAYNLSLDWLVNGRATDAAMTDDEEGKVLEDTSDFVYRSNNNSDEATVKTLSTAIETLSQTNSQQANIIATLVSKI